MTERQRMCSKCFLYFDLSDFRKRSDKPHLYDSQCKDCRRETVNESYARNKEKTNEARRLKQEEKRKPARRYVFEYLSTHPCVDCGNSDWRVLEFDHVRGDKWKNVCDIMDRPLQVVIDEIAKCESVCANCHKIRSYTRADSWRMRPEYGVK